MFLVGKINKGNKMAKITQEFVEAALTLADMGQSKISETEREAFGLSSVRLRALLNNLCSVKDVNYLELGVYRGATLFSAVYGNPTCKAVGVENYRYEERELKRWAPDGEIWPNMKSQLLSNIQRYKEYGNPVTTDNITIVESNFEDVDWSGMPKFDIVFYDIAPTNASLYEAFITKVLPALSAESVVVFSNYSNQQHGKDLDAAFANHANVVDIQWKKQRVSGGLSDATQYYSGIAIMGLKKKLSKTIIKPAVK